MVGEQSPEALYQRAFEKSEELRELAHDEYPHGEVTAQINIFDDDTFNATVRHAHQERVDGELRTTHEMWDYNSENDELVRQTWIYPPGTPPYAAPESVEEQEIQQCGGCGELIEADETTVHADDGVKYHMGCDIAEPCCEVGSGGFERGESGER